MKKTLCLIVILSLCVFVGCDNTKVNDQITEENRNNEESGVEVNYEKVKHEVGQAMVQTDNCSSYKVMKKEADVIVKGRKADERFADSLAGNSTKYLLSQIEIEKIYKDKTNLGLEQGKSINVHENEEYEPEYNTIYHIDDYRKMETGKEYYLFLNYTPEYDRYYILGVHRGKIPVDDNEKIFYKEDNSTAVEQDRDVIQKIVKEVQETYE